MSAKISKVAAAPAVRWLFPTVGVGLLAAGVISYGNSTERQAAAGSPYYGKAVQEAINGLVNAGATPAVPEGQPALPAGLSPADYYWCDKCKAYHRRDAGAGAGVAAAPALAAAGSESAIPPLPAGLSAADYYWCVNCKAYHPRDKDHPAAAAAWSGVPFRLPGTQP